MRARPGKGEGAGPRRGWLWVSVAPGLALAAVLFLRAGGPPEPAREGLLRMPAGPELVLHQPPT